MAQHLTFENWMRRVDFVIGRACGLSHRDLPDWTYADAWEDGYTAEEAAAEAMQAAEEF